MRIVFLGLVVVIGSVVFSSCAGNPQATAKYYLSDKPQEDRVPVSNQADPAGAEIAPIQ
jgi:hypothetical protein